ncbi:cupredoxin domain-containing protein [Haloarcula onubensis]|uniref:Plastocyanin/azurin family copper-binding protein n=1 Tax=Haloarcula onubensis TaxID=2950539 RepID=A0ABU2FRA1_9EURY|nr:plastocyanin/azurin family copper-binding protein [Halomicroarcula sp. S3CR25-11]MDS0282681.1 plastocyanin/azurin family copper-binding protein [Halomicroarcula sp. S3CR25-11]
MSQPGLTRRRLLEGTAGLAVAGLAGCNSATSGSGEQTAGGTPTESGGDNHPGHGDEAHGHDTVSEPRASREVAVNTARTEDSTEYHFDPHVTWVEPGGTVTWRLESGTHTATAYHPGNDQPRLVPEGTAAWDSGTMSEEGETFEHTFETEGVYHYYCTPHESFGMLATVIVGQPHLEDQQALRTIPEDKPEEVRAKLQELNGMCRDILSEGHQEEEEHHEEDTSTEGGHHEAETHSGQST